MNNAFSYSATQFEASIEDIREYAYHLYWQSGCIGGRDMDNWLEAIACLKANMSLYGADTPRHFRLAASADSEPVDFARQETGATFGVSADDPALVEGRAAKHISQDDFDQVKDDRRVEVEANQHEAAPGSQPELKYWHAVPGSKLDGEER
jgi:DUF2934 family protein